MLHVQLNRFPHSARAFNLSVAEVRATITDPWEAGRMIELGERFWTPGECKLTILEGPELATSELGMGRGWTAARKRGRDVTDELIRAPGAADPRSVAAGPPFAEFKEEVLALSVRAAMPLHDVWRLASRRYPERPLSERLGLAERAVHELLHDELSTLAGGDPPVLLPGAEAERVMRAFETWAPPAGPCVCLRATGRGERAHQRG